jgi:hypothetical protein
MRAEVSHLVSKGPLPASNSSVQQIKEWQEAFEKIEPPISDEEARVLTGLFPATEDDCFGLAWSLIHLVETSPQWPLEEYLKDTRSPWIARLRSRAQNDWSSDSSVRFRF